MSTIRKEVFNGYIDPTVKNIINVDRFGCLDQSDIYLTKSQDGEARKVRVTIEVLTEEEQNESITTR